MSVVFPADKTLAGDPAPLTLKRRAYAVTPQPTLQSVLVACLSYSDGCIVLDKELLFSLAKVDHCSHVLDQLRLQVESDGVLVVRESSEMIGAGNQMHYYEASFSYSATLCKIALFIRKIMMTVASITDKKGFPSRIILADDMEMLVRALSESAMKPSLSFYDPSQYRFTVFATKVE